MEPKVHFHTYKCQPPVPVLRQINPVHAPHPMSWRFIIILSSHLRLGVPSSLFPSGFPTKTLYIPLLSPIRATCPAHLILFDLITRTILGEDYISSRPSSNAEVEELVELCLYFSSGPSWPILIWTFTFTLFRSITEPCELGCWGALNW